jgi:EAL domain-containing protein (putative c-di-GMP-specific phosphodiesterase class I)
VDVLKVDRSFVEPLGTSVKSAALVRSIVELAAALEMECVAEGVENEQQVVTLRSLGCHLAQGFMFAKPRPAEEMLRMLAIRPSSATATV